MERIHMGAIRSPHVYHGVHGGTRVPLDHDMGGGSMGGHASSETSKNQMNLPLNPSDLT